MTNSSSCSDSDSEYVEKETFPMQKKHKTPTMNNDELVKRLIT